MILAIALAVTPQDIGWLAGDWQLTTGGQCSEDYACSRRAAAARRCGL